MHKNQNDMFETCITVVGFFYKNGELLLLLLMMMFSSWCCFCQGSLASHPEIFKSEVAIMVNNKVVCTSCQKCYCFI